MSIEVLLVQFLVLAFTGIVWWVARRDLASRPIPPPLAPAADTQELEQVCITLEALVTDLSRRLAAMEQRFPADAAALPAAPLPALSPSLKSASWPPEAAAPSFLFDPPEAAENEPENKLHTALYALLAEGVTDPAEITRRTGLGRGEVDLILSLRARRAL